MFDGSGSFFTAPPKPSKLVEGEKRLSNLKRDYDALGDQLRKLSNNIDGNIVAIERLERERHAVVAEITKLRSDVVKAQTAHGAKVREAMGPAISTAAARAVLAVTDLQSALDVLSDIDAELTRGCAASLPIFPPDLGQLAERLARLAN